MNLDFTTIIIAVLVIWVLPVVVSVLYLKRSSLGFPTAIGEVFWPISSRVERLLQIAFDKNVQKEVVLQGTLDKEYKALEQSATKIALSLADEMKKRKELDQQLRAAHELLQTTYRRKRKKKSKKQRAKAKELTPDDSQKAKQRLETEEKILRLTEQRAEQSKKIRALEDDLAAIQQQSTSVYWRTQSQIAQVRLEEILEQSQPNTSVLDRMELKVRIKEARASSFFRSQEIQPSPEMDLSKLSVNLSGEEKEKLVNLHEELTSEHLLWEYHHGRALNLSNTGVRLTPEQIEMLQNLNVDILQEIEEERKKLQIEQQQLDLERNKQLQEQMQQRQLELSQKHEIERLQKIQRDLRRKVEIERSVREYVAAEIERRRLYKDTYERTSKKLQMFIDKTSTVGKKLRVIREAAMAADPNIERAYNRLAEQLALGRKLMDASFEQEARLEQQLKKHQGKFDNIDLEAALKNHRRKNLATEHQLFRVDGIVRRLYMVMILLKALPASKAEELLQYTNVVNDLCSYLSQSWEGTTEIKAPIEFSDRITQLEHSTLMAFVRIAKVDWKTLNDSAIGTLKEKVAEVKTIIESERQNQSDEANKWSNLAGKASEENKELIYFVASQRRDQCREILKITEQSLEVLDLSLTVAEKKRNDSAQAG